MAKITLLTTDQIAAIKADKRATNAICAQYQIGTARLAKIRGSSPKRKKASQPIMARIKKDMMGWDAPTTVAELSTRLAIKPRSVGAALRDLASIGVVLVSPADQGGRYTYSIAVKPEACPVQEYINARYGWTGRV
jgi:hypothetical protein